MSPARRGIYLDWNATTPPAPEVLEAMTSAQSAAWGNPASVHAFGRAARSLVERAREKVAELVGFEARDVVLTSGGTEANNLALMSFFADVTPTSAARPGLVLSAIEHPSVLRVAETLRQRGVDIRLVQPNPEGVATVEAFAQALDSLEGRARLVSLLALSHETGVIQPVGAVAEVAHAAGAKMHSDIVQAAGKLPRDAWSGADLVSLTAHKMRGPKGVGAVATRLGVKLHPVLLGGAQEKGVRPGTQDAVAAAGFAAAVERARPGATVQLRIAVLRDRLEAGLLSLGAVVNGAGPRAAHVTNLSFGGHRGPELVAALDLEGIAVSSGSACSAGTPDPSPVIEAMVGVERAVAAVRFSLGETTSDDDIERTLAAVRTILAR